MNLDTQLQSDAFSDLPVLKAGLELARQFVANRWSLVAPLDVDGESPDVIRSHLKSHNLPPVIVSHERLTEHGLDVYASVVSATVPEYRAKYGPTSAEGWILFNKLFVSELEEAASFPVSDVRRRIYTCTVATSYVHELAHSKYHRFGITGITDPQFDEVTPDKLKPWRGGVGEAGSFAEVHMFGGCIEIAGTKDRRFLVIEDAFGRVVNVKVRVSRWKSVRINLAYVELLEKILSGSVNYETREAVVDAAKASLASANQRRSETAVEGGPSPKQFRKNRSACNEEGDSGQTSADSEEEDSDVEYDFLNRMYYRKPRRVDVSWVDERLRVFVEDDEDEKLAFCVYVEGAKLRQSRRMIKCTRSLGPRYFVSPGENYIDLRDRYSLDGLKKIICTVSVGDYDEIVLSIDM